MPVRTLLGMETEYAVSGMDASGHPVNRAGLVEAMLARARRLYPHLKDGSGTGLFMANGARLYIDRGSHPEFSTPECEDPREVLHYVREGETLLLELAERVRAEQGLGAVQVFRSNVDYGRSGATWGCHESYLHRTSPQLLPLQLIPHLVTRMIYAGAGGFVPLSPGLEFTLSPRAWLITNPTSSDSTGNRGIYHLKDESLSGAGWHRLHVICGESLCSDTAALLKIGTTALVLASIEACRRPGDAVRLAAPVEALQTVATGQDRKRGLALAAGGRLSAAEIQRHYLAVVEECRAQGFLPAWAGPVCELWRRQLDAYESDAPSLEHTLDWAIKRSLYRSWARGRLGWDRLRQCGEVLVRLERAAARLAEPGVNVSVEHLLDPGGPMRREMLKLTPLLAVEGLSWADLGEFLKVRQQLQEADLRFGQLGPVGVFTQLDRKGVLAHRIPDPGFPLPPPFQPPRRGRARVRGEWIRRLNEAGDYGRWRCDWSTLWDESTGRTLDLSDPFVTAAEWRGP